MFTHWDEVGKVKASACSISGHSQTKKSPNAPPIRSSLMLLRLASAAAMRVLLLRLQVILLVMIMLTEMVVLTVNR